MIRDSSFFKRYFSVAFKGFEAEEPILLTLLDEAIPENEEQVCSCLNLILELYFRCGQTEHAIKFYKKMSESHPKLIPYLMVAKGFYAADEYELALEALKLAQADHAEWLKNEDYPFPESLYSFIEYYAIELGILSKIDPNSERIEQLISYFNMQDWTWIRTSPILYDSVIRLHESKNLNKKSQLIPALLSTFEHRAKDLKSEGITDLQDKIESLNRILN